jgi:hypothetical protein
VTAFLEVGRVDYVDNFDSAEGLFDSREGEFDGSPNAFDDTNVELQVAVTNDDPAGSPTYSAFRKFFVGDYKARGFRFRAVLTSRDAQASPSVSLLQVEVDMPDRVTSGDDIASTTAAGGVVVNFAPAFKEPLPLSVLRRRIWPLETSTKSSQRVHLALQYDLRTLEGRWLTEPSTLLHKDMANSPHNRSK